MLRVLAIALIVLGVVMIAYPVITYSTRETVVDVGPVEVTADREHHIPLPPVLGAVAAAGGVILLVTTRRR